MKPVLLDQRSLFKAGTGIFLGMLVVFFSGYYLGHQKAAPGDGIKLNTTMALALPRPAYADLAELEQQPPRSPGPGANIDVDSPDPAANAAAVVIGGGVPGGSVPGADGSNTIAGIIEDSVAAGSVDPANQQLQLASLGAATAAITKESEAAVVEPVRQGRPGAASEPAPARIEGAGSESMITDNASADDARYTIQVGVFADEQNALRRKSELESSQLSAYITRYANKRDEPRFNVRFGYFKNKSSALAALQTFEHHMSGSGYVARIRRN